MQDQVPPYVPNDPPIGNASLEEFGASMTLLDQASTAQDNKGDFAPANPIGGMGSTRVMEFLRMNPPEVYISKVEEEPNGFIDEVYKVLAIIGVHSIDKAELAAYQYKYVAQLCYEQWKYSRTLRSGPIEWETFKLTSLDRVFTRELREDILEVFINPKHGSLSVKEYALNFTLFSKYAPILVSNLRDLMNRFMMWVSELVEEECRMTMLVDDMNISKIMVFAQKNRRVHDLGFRKRKIGWTRRVLMDIIVLRFNNSFSDKVILVVQIMRIKGCVTVDPKRRISIPYLLALGVV